jgi:hypothetical protein
MKVLAARSPHPFWPVTLLSGGAATLACAALLVAYLRLGRWQYLALGGLALLVALAHGVAWWLARARGQGGRALWLIAAAQILGAVLAPLVVADLWSLGLLLLAVVPLEVGAVDHPRRMPLSAVFALLGAAAMIAVDLASLPARVALLSDVPRAAPLVTGLVALHAVGLALVLWRQHLRPSAGQRVRLDLATQLSLFFIAFSAASIVLVTGVLIVQIRAAQIDQVGRNFQVLANISAERTGNSLEQQVIALASLGRRETVLLEGLAAANAAYPGSPEQARQLLQERDRRWRASAEGSDFVLQYRNNPQSLALSKFRGGGLLHNNVLLTDRQGGLVAAQGERPARFWYGDVPWWRTAWNDGQGGTYLGELTVDPRTKVASILIAVGVLNPQTNQTIGVLASTYELRGIQRDITAATTPTGEVRLLAADGVVIAGPDARGIGQPVPGASRGRAAGRG